MKKIIGMATMVAFFSISNVNAQSGLSNLLGKVLGNKNETTETSVADTTNNNLLSNVLGTLIGNSMPVSQDMIVGTWNYTSVACVLSSDEALADIGGTLGSSKIEETLNKYLAKVGVKEGACSLTFADGEECTFEVAGKSVNGTYSYNAEDKKIEFVFYKKLKMTADVAYNMSTLNVVFNADKLLSLVKTVTSKVSGASGEETEFSSLMGGSSSSTLATISSLLENYDGMMLGLKLKK